MPSIDSSERCALAIAHPGHEIRIFGWLEANRPLTFILTDGSGRNGASRLKSSASLLGDVGAPAGSIFGVFSDRQVYAHVLAKNADPFLRLADELAAQWVRHEIDTVLGDASEGSIMTHDLWRGVIDRAVELASRQRGISIRNLSFSLEADPRTARVRANPLHTRVELGGAAWERKIQAAESYEGLQSEVRKAFSLWGKAAFRTETIFSQPPASDCIDWPDKPKYELHGESQVSAGLYRQVVRYRKHVRPILAALQSGRRLGERAA